MKKIILIFVVALSAQIVVNAQLNDATLKKKGTQNEASTVAWLQSVKPDATLINMPVKSFNREFKNALTALNKKYGTFPAVTDDVINDEIIPKLFTKEMSPGLHRLSWYDPVNDKWGSWKRERKMLPDGPETGLYFPGWEESVMSVYCWNFEYPDDSPAPAPVNNKTEVVVIPGVNKYFYKTDTIRERYDSYKEVQNNFFVTKNNNTFTKVDNQSFTVEDKTSYTNNNCGCQEQKSSCGCDKNSICRDHYEQLPKKYKKNFFNTAGGRTLTHLAAAVGGYFLGRWIFDSDGGGVPNQQFTQGPFEPVIANTPVVFTQGPYN